LRLSGREADGTELEGHVLDPITGEEGVWNLTRTAVQQQLTPEQASELRSWFSIRRDVDKLEEQLEALRLKSDSQRARIDKFQRYVFNDNALKETAASRLGSTAGSIQTVRTEVDSLRAKLDESIRALETAERVSPAGNLVGLSRETLQRESRWIELTLRLLAPETTAGFEQSLERAYRVKTLQDRIADERRKLADLENESDLRSYENEEEFYREMGQ
jgi:cell division protein FtsB